MSTFGRIRDIVIVDDHPLFSDGLTHILRLMSPDARVTAFANLREALDGLAGDLACELILLDLSLPDAQGFEALTRLRELRPEAAAVVVSGSFDTTLIVQCLDHGAAGFIPKTASQQRTVEALDWVVQGGVYVPEEVATAGGVDLDQVRELAAHRRAMRARDVAAASAHPSLSSGPSVAAQSDVAVMERADPVSPLAPPRATPATLAPGRSSGTDPRALGLTQRQTDVLRLMVRGLPNKLICRALNLAEGTVKVHVSAVLRALGVRTRTQAVIAASQLGLRLT